MTVDEVMDQLKLLGTEQTKKTFSRHGAKEPLFGVKIGDLKPLVKRVKKDQALALALYDTGNHDAMYLAGLSVDPKAMTREQLQNWIERAYWHMLAECTVANVAAESHYALDLAGEWMASTEETIASCGWSTYTSYLSVTPDEQLDFAEIRRLLKQVEKTIHQERNRVRYTMNNFVIAVGSFVAGLHEEALEVSGNIGKVHVDVGQTACKVPLAANYIEKVKAKGRIGVKKKTCIC